MKTGDAGFFDQDRASENHRPRQGCRQAQDGSLFAPKYIENKLKFYPNIKEVVAYGDGRDFVTVLLNIDLTAVGNWAERNNVVYGSYQELAGGPARLRSDRAACRRGESLARGRRRSMAGAQIRRFLILHKELDADDGEVTRTQKVRRGFVAERYKPLIDALYDGSKEADISTEVTFEDGRKGVISGA